MTEETPGFEEKPDVPTDAKTAEAQQGGPDGAGNAPAGARRADGAGPGATAGNGDANSPLAARLDETRKALDERTKDLQRLQAEYQNYRRRVERDRVAVKEVANANLLTELLPVLDDIGRARDHEELVGGFKSVAESLETVVAKMGLMQFGKEGEPFDPLIHEALMHSYSPDVSETTCVQILQPGYRIGERTIRPARVAVAEPQPGATPGSQGKEGEKPDEKQADADDGGPESAGAADGGGSDASGPAKPGSGGETDSGGPDEG
ncbi:heat shock protein GrpE [Streptomyces sp. CNQ-509]|uniref:nucleotide exchange factor GrpE n=1 Tax=unclassified Streptomyces TaxID=2593676 RepID=UPI00062DD476|nr:nucleotide exchange factor GrpE [Streptomyces sp. CNQ-509]AKH83719.1 heat shock protein GrpE [Streptomyces sp. CNQ-509]